MVMQVAARISRRLGISSRRKWVNVGISTNQRVLAVVSVLSLVWLGLGGPAGAAPKFQSCPGNPAAVTDRGHGWRAVAPPEFPAALARKDDLSTLPSVNPQDPAGSLQRIQDYAVPKEQSLQPEGFSASDVDPNVLYATDSDALMRSDDGGCTWKLVLALGDYAGKDPVRVQVPRNNLGKDLLGNTDLTSGPAIADTWSLKGADGGEYLYVRTTSHPPTKPGAKSLPSDVLLLSRDGGKSWDKGSDTDYPRRLLYPDNAVFAPSNPEIIYSGDNIQYETGTQIVAPHPSQIWVTYRSTDGGLTWGIPGCPIVKGPRSDTDEQAQCEDKKIEEMKSRESFDSFAPPGPPSNDFMFAVDPLDPDVVWQAGDARLRRSTDGGKTWTDIKSAEAQTSRNPFELYVDHRRGKPAVLLGMMDRQKTEDGSATSASSQMVILSQDGGESWTKIGYPNDQDPFTSPAGGWGFFGPRTHRPIVGFNPGQGNGESGFPTLYRIDLRSVGLRDPWVPLPYIDLSQSSLPYNTTAYTLRSGAKGTWAEISPFGFQLCYCSSSYYSGITPEIIIFGGRL